MINKAKDFPFTQIQGKIELNDSTIEKFQVNEPTKPNAYVEVKATGKGLTYQWYIKLKDTEEWKEIGDSNVSRYYIGGLSSVSKELNGAKFKCKVSNSKGSVISDEVTLTIAEEEMPTITAQPTNQTVDPGEYDALTKRKFARYVVAVNGNGSGSGTTDEHNKGWFADPATLPTIGENGDYAIVGTTDTVWVWDSDTNKWVDTGATNTVKTVNSIGPDETGNISLSADNISDLNIGDDGRTITIGTKSVSPLTPDSAIAANKIEGTVASATKASQDAEGNIISATYAKSAVVNTSLSTKQDISNLVTSFSTTTSDTKYPSEKLVYSSLGALSQTITGLENDTQAVSNNKADKATTLAGYNIGDAYTKTEVNTELDKKQNSSNLVTEITAESLNTTYPSAKAVYDYVQTLIQQLKETNNLQ